MTSLSVSLSAHFNKYGAGAEAACTAIAHHSCDSSVARRKCRNAKRLEGEFCQRLRLPHRAQRALLVSEVSQCNVSTAFGDSEGITADHSRSQPQQPNMDKRSDATRSGVLRMNRSFGQHERLVLEARA